MMIHLRQVGKFVLGLLLAMTLVGIRPARCLAEPAIQDYTETAWLRAMGLGREFPNPYSVVLLAMKWEAGLKGKLQSQRQDDPLVAATAAQAAGDYQTVADLVQKMLDGEGGYAREDFNRLHLQLRLAAAYIELGRNEDAIALLDEVLPQCPEASRPVSRCFALLNRGRAGVRMRQLEEPREDLLQAERLARELEVPGWQGTAAIALSVISRLQMDLEDALQWRRQALAAYEVAGDVPGQALALHYIGTIHAMQGDLTRAMSRFSRALELSRRTEDQRILGAVLGEMANVNYLLGDFENALDQYREASRLVGHPWRRGMMLINMGSIHEYRGDYELALEAQTQALELMRQVGDRGTEAQALMAIGEIQCEQKRFAEGLANLEQALTMARETENTVLEAYILKCQGHGLLDSGRLEDAVETLARATAAARTSDYFDILEWSLLGEAMAARLQGRWRDALAHLEDALAEVSLVRRRSGGSAAFTGGIVREAGGIFEEAIGVLHHLHQQEPGAGHDHRAFTVAQQARDRAFLDLLAEADFDLRFSGVPGYQQREGEILQRIITLERDLNRVAGQAALADSAGALRALLAAAEDDLHLLEADLRQQDPRYAEVLYPRPLELEQVQREVLLPDELLLEFALGDSASYLWAVGAGGEVQFRELPPRREIEDLVGQLLPLLQDYNLTGGQVAWLQPQAHAAHEMLVGPVGELVARYPHLVVVPDGILHYLPFGTLVSDGTAVESCRQLAFLARSKVITSAPSAGALARVRRPDAEEEEAGWLLVGDPRLPRDGETGFLARAAGSEGLPPLPLAGEEIAALAALAPENSSTVLTRERATAAGVRAAAAGRSYRLVHFATHGLFNEDRPRFSGLVLSADSAAKDDGFLGLSEVLGMHLSCRQVVLSACSSALGGHVTGEGISGLHRSFLFAGARSVVAALWDVNGEATARLMADFYGTLAQPGVSRIDRAEALTAAQRHMINSDEALASGADPAHPAFWGAFVMSGDGR